MKKIITISFSILFLAAFLWSCKKDFLDVQNVDKISSDVFPTSYDKLNLELNTVYADLHANGLWGVDYIQKVLYPSDHTSDQDYIDFPEWNGVHQNKALVNDGYIESLWSACYTGIQACNTLLEDVANYRVKYIKGGEGPKLDVMEGQTRFFRAYYYSVLVNRFGETFIKNGVGGDKKGVPLITKTAKTINETYVKRATIRQTWDTIFSDLKKSEMLLKDTKSWDSQNQGRVTVWSVKSLMGQGYLYTEDWANAKAKFEDVITNSGKTLMPFDQYKDMFIGKYENNNESIFEVNLAYDVNGWGAFGGAVTSQTAALYFAPAFLNGNGGESSSGFSNIYLHDQSLKRFGFAFANYITLNPAFDGAKGESFTNLKHVFDPAILSQSALARKNKTVDPRLWVSGLQPYLDSMVSGGNKVPIIKYIGSYDNGYGFSLRKYQDLSRTEYSSNAKNGSNMYVIRLADIYLMYAESLINSGGSASTALEYINKVHRRAYGYDYTAPSPVDYVSLTDATKATGDAVLKNDILKYERWAEFLGEGEWWTDVCRWKIGAQEAAIYKKVKSGPIQWNEARSYALPIPIKELNNNTALTGQQNPGY